ncbi:MAG: hypothetical protein GX417_02655, partial [Clostridiales bacterium]|nr:hypothetical protein [Clostridiales bacterium]
MQVFRMREIRRNAIRSISQIFCMGFCLFLLAGCTVYNPNMNKLDSVTFSANLKEDTFSPNGKKATYYDGRIYYLSSELDTQGIYSMDVSGEDIRLEIPTEDIRAIQIQDDAINYAGFTGIKENAAGPYRQFRLYSRKNGANASSDFLLDATYSDNLRDENVWDFYLSETGTSILRFVNIVGYDGSSGLSAVCFQNGIAVPLSDYQKPVMYQKARKGLVNQALLSIAYLNNLFVDLGNTIYDNPEQTERLTGRGSISVYDANAATIATQNDRLFSDQSAYADSEFARWFCRVQEDRMIFASVRGLETYDSGTKVMSDTVSFSPPECVFNQIDCGESILVFTELLRNNYWANYWATDWFHQNRALSESLYRVDPDTGEKTRILTTGRNQAFLYADRQIAAIGGGKTIFIYDISADTPKLLRTVELTH